MSLHEDGLILHLGSLNEYEYDLREPLKVDEAKYRDVQIRKRRNVTFPLTSSRVGGEER
jgi:hypothetical protein